MSDMVQQPVIQLVQELTMTAVVEQHDCTDLEKKKEKKCSRPRMNTNNSFVCLPFIENIQKWNFSEPPNLYSFINLNYNSSDDGTEDIPHLCAAGEGPDPLASPAARRRTGRRRGMFVIQTRPTQLATLSFRKLSSKYQWDMLALEGHLLHTQGSWKYYKLIHAWVIKSCWFFS